MKHEINFLCLTQSCLIDTKCARQEQTGLLFPIKICLCHKIKKINSKIFLILGTLRTVREINGQHEIGTLQRALKQKY